MGYDRLDFYYGGLLYGPAHVIKSRLLKSRRLFTVLEGIELRRGDAVMIKGAIFDADGTLLDSMPMWSHTGELYLRRLGIRAKPGLAEAMFPLSLPDCADYLKREYRLPLTPQEIMDGVNGTIRDFYRNQVQLKPGALDFLIGLKERGVELTLATATDRPLIEDGLRRTGVLKMFRGIFTCTEMGAGKEKPDIFYAAMHRMRTIPANTWVLEDAAHAARTARAAGFRVAGVYDPASEARQEELRKCSHLYLRNLRDFRSFYCQAEEIE